MGEMIGVKLAQRDIMPPVSNVLDDAYGVDVAGMA
jgi:hypothetical protein